MYMPASDLHACKRSVTSDSQTRCSRGIGVQIPHLLEAGYRVVTPDLRGALGGESSLPQEPEAYHIEKHIVKDVAGVPERAPIHAACCKELCLILQLVHAF